MARASNKIQVCVRLRPLNDREKKDETLPVVTASTAKKTVTVVRGSGKLGIRHGFKFDRVFGSFTSQGEIFDQTLRPIVDDVMSGFEATVFAYGQTGTGKTYTMEGVIDDPENMGVIPRAARSIFERISQPKYISSEVSCSYLEIYNEDLCDLLADESKKASKLVICTGEDKSTKCVGLSKKKITKAEQIISILHAAQRKRQVAETEMNKFSSRSHCLFTLTIKTTEQLSGCVMERQGKLHLVDLAGSESAKATGISGKRLRESMNINQSLLTLGRVINALRSKQSRIPYRDSKLTRLLKEALGGRSKTCIIATLSPSVLCVDETLSTLNYAQRANGIKNKMRAAAVSMSVSGGGNGSDSVDAANTQSFIEMEMRVKYMETQCEEAQAALARKHLLMEEAQDALAAQQEELDVTKKGLAEAQSDIEQLKATRYRLQKQVAKIYNEGERLQLLIDARTATEHTLQAHSTDLLRSIDTSHKQSEELHEKLEQQTQVQKDHFDSTDAFCFEALALLKRLQQQSELVCTAQRQQHAEVKTFMATDVNAQVTSLLKALQDRVETLTTLAEEAGAAFGKNVAAAKASSTEATETMTTAQHEMSAKMMAKLQDTATRTQEQLQQLMDSVTAESAELTQWRARNKDAADSCKNLRDAALSSQQQQLSDFESATTALIQKQEQLVLALRQKSTAAAESLDQIAASNKLHQSQLEDTFKRAAAASTSMQESLQKQQHQLTLALEQHAEPEASNTRTLLTDLHTQQMAALATHDKSLGNQQTHIADTLAIDAKQQQQRANHTQQIADLLESATNQSSKQQELLASQKANLELAAQRQSEGNLQQVQLESLGSHRAHMEAASTQQVELMREQMETLTQTLKDHTENDPEGHHLDTLHKTKNNFQTCAAANRALIERQQDTLAQHRQQQQEQAKQFMTVAMDTFKAMMEEQMSSMSSLLTEQTSNLTAANATLIEQEAEMEKKFEANAQQAVQETTAWGVRLNKVAKSMEDVIMVQNTDMTKSVEQHAAHAHTAVEGLCQQTNKWGASNDTVLKQVNGAIATTAEADGNAVMLETTVADATTDLTAHTADIGATETDVMARLSTMQQQQQLLIQEADDISTKAAADKHAVDEQLVKWVNKEERVAEQMQQVVTEVGVCEAKRAAAATDLESRLSREAVSTTVQQTQRVETVCAGVRQQVADEVTACEGVATSMHADLGEFQKNLTAHITAATKANAATHSDQVSELATLAEARCKAEKKLSGHATSARELVNVNASEVITASKAATAAITTFSSDRTQWWSSFVDEQTAFATKNIAASVAEKQAADARVSAGEEHFAKASQNLDEMTTRFAHAQEKLHEQVVAEVDDGSSSVTQLRQQTAKATEKIPAPHTLATPEVEREIAATPEDLEVESKHGFVRFEEAVYDSEHAAEAAAAAANSKQEQVDDLECETQVEAADVQSKPKPVEDEPAKIANKQRSRRSADSENTQTQNTAGLPPRGRAKSKGGRSRSRSRGQIQKPKTRSRSRSASSRRGVLTSR